MQPGYSRLIARGLDFAATIAVILLCAVVGWQLLAKPAGRTAPKRPSNEARQGPPVPLPDEPVRLDGVVTRGSEKAGVVLIAYSEFKCPYCGVFARETMPALVSKYVESGKIRFAFRHFPLDAIHPFARQAAKTVECSRPSGRFWTLHDRMFSNQSSLGDDTLQSHLRELGIAKANLDACIEGEGAARVQADVNSGRELGVTGTPTFFVGLEQQDGRFKIVDRLNGARPIGEFESLIDRWLGEQSAHTVSRR